MTRRILVLVFLGVVCAAAVGWSLRDAAGATLLDELARARPARTFAPRLSIETEYRPCVPLPPEEDETVPRMACGTNEDARVDLDELAAAGKSSDPNSLRASALGMILWPDKDAMESSLNAAIERLDIALLLTSARTPLLVDLSAAYLARAEHTQNPRDLAEALEHAREALEREPGNAAALFNAALAQELQAIDEEAVKAWKRYLAVDSTSAWATEAKERMRAVLESPPPLEKPDPGASQAEVDTFARLHPQEARLLGWDSVLGEWGRAWIEDEKVRADSLLHLAAMLGSALERDSGDASLADAVRAIRENASDTNETRKLARAHRAYAAGQRSYWTHDHPVALDSFTQAMKAQPLSLPLSQWAKAFQGGTQVYESHNEAAESAFRALLSEIDSIRHPALVARTRWMWGTHLLRTDHYAEARVEFKAAARIFERLGETEYLGAMQALDGEAAFEESDTLAAYASLHEALLNLRPYRRSVWLHNALQTLAHFSTTDGMHRAAAPIQDEGVAVAMRVDLPHTAPEALLGRARAMAIGRHTDRALRDLDSAAVRVERIEVPRMRDDFEKLLRYSRAIVESQIDPARASMALDSAVSHFADDVLWLLPALIQRIDTRLALADTAGAIADLDTVTTRVRGLSNESEDASLRAAMIEAARSRFDQLVMLHANAGREKEALLALERSRVSFASTQDASSRATPVRLEVPRRKTVIEYALIDGALLTWTVRDTVVRMTRQTLDGEKFARIVEWVGASLEAPERADAAMPHLRLLYDVLIRPIKDQVDASETLVFVADGEVAAVPFSALLDRESGRYLIETHTPSVAVSLAAAARAPSSNRMDGAPPALLVANPAFDERHHTFLRPLRWAHGEVAPLLDIYPNAVFLADSGATVASLVEKAPRAGLIHYAGHAVFDDARPERSYLLLAGRGESGRLTAEAIRDLELEGVRLVVLSACRTVRARGGRSGGFTGLSRAFFEAGVGGVVGSLWNASDTLTPRLMQEFHRAYRPSRDPAEALREAQLTLLRSTDPADAALRSPAAWAGFRYVGSGRGEAREGTPSGTDTDD